MSRRSVEAALALAVIAFLHLPFTSEASYTLRVRAHRYWNSGHKLADGSCCDKTGSSSCDPFWCTFCECDNRFKFCLRGFGANRDSNEQNCPLGSYSTGEIGDDGFSFGSSQIASGVSNPMIFRGDIWRGGFQMFVSIYDEDDINNDDHVDDLYAQERLNPGQSISEREYTGSRSNSHITFSFSISCDSNFYGSDCATYCVPTNNNQGHYWCDSSTGQKRCRPGWTDPDNNCLTPVCATNCHVVGGYCNAPRQCLCREGWSGSSCDQCQLRPGCSAVGGYCDVPGECICRDDYSGAHCEVDLIPCQRGENPCSNDAPCINDGVGGYMCHCPAGWTGTHCGEEINECDPNPCHSGSSCVDEVAGFTCVCTEGFEGDYCHIDIDDCESSPCQNSGTCVDRPNGFLCHCPIGYEGTVCESNHDDCTPYPCENGGTCHDLVGGYECDCEVGWTGDRCQVDIDDCVSTPCQNGGSCYDEVNGYVCVCQSGWYGDDCQLEVNECESNPCLNGATCMDLLDSYNCSCAPDYYGDHCQYQYDDCLSEPCQNQGTCTDLINSYTCECHADFSGANCEINLNPCSSNPCQNGGTCIRHDNGYACMCPPDYTDYNCAATIDIRIEGVASDNNEGIERYVVWAVPSGGLLIIILIVAVVIISLFWCRKRKRVPILPPPSLPMDDGIETGKVLGKGVPMETIIAANPVYGAKLPDAEYHIYEDLNTYDIPRQYSPEKIPLDKDLSDEMFPATTFMTDQTTGTTENHYANVD